MKDRGTHTASIAVSNEYDSANGFKILLPPTRKLTKGKVGVTLFIKTCHAGVALACAISETGD